MRVTGSTRRPSASVHAAMPRTRQQRVAMRIPVDLGIQSCTVDTDFTRWLSATSGHPCLKKDQSQGKVQTPLD